MALLVATAFPRPRWPTLGWALGAALLLTTGVNGGYPRDVELIEPVARNPSHNDVYDPPPKVAASPLGRHHYPSYVKGQDPVEEYNRRRLHVDTSRYLSGHREAPSHWDGHRQLEVEGRTLRERYGQQRRPEGKSDRLRQKKVQHREEVDRDKSAKGRRQKVKDPIKRRVGRRAMLDADAPRRYEESDPNVFPYERTEPVAEGDEDTGKQTGLPYDVKFFQDLYCEQTSPLELEFGHLYETQDGWEERYERQDHKNHRHQGKVKWADKKGGFGEHYWDLNHVTS